MTSWGQILSFAILLTIDRKSAYLLH